MSSCSSLSASSTVLAPHRNCLLMFLVLVRSPLIPLLQAVVNNALLDTELMQCHMSLLTARMFLMVHQRIFSTKFAATFCRLHHLAVHLSYICGECNLVCSKSQNNRIQVLLYCRTYKKCIIQRQSVTRMT